MGTRASRITIRFPPCSGGNCQAAYNDGVTQANNAATAAGALGLPVSIIYVDIENYTPDDGTGGTCSLPVQNYLGGWDTQMHTLAGAGSAGVYGNVCPALKDFVNALPEPDDVWIAAWDNRRTIWGLSAPSCSIPDSGTQWWTSNQRMHQFSTNASGKYGGFSYSLIDQNVDDAAVLANNGSKTYSWTTQSAGQCYAAGIYDATHWGGYQYVGNVFDACLYSNGTVTDIAPQWAVLGSGAAGINGLGQAVGYGWDSNYGVHGFIYNPGIGSTQIDYTGANCTMLTGINDDGLAVGTWWDFLNVDDCDDPASTMGAFMYNGSKFTPMSFPDAVCTQVTGINGDNQIVGGYCTLQSECQAVGPFDCTSGFAYSGGEYTDISAGIDDPWGINDSGQVSGEAYPQYGLYNLNLGPGSFVSSPAAGLPAIDDAADLALVAGAGNVYITKTH